MLLNNNGGFTMEEQKKYKQVTIRIPDELYSDYKEALHEDRAIPTYDIRNHMRSVVEQHKKTTTNFSKIKH